MKVVVTTFQNNVQYWKAGNYKSVPYILLNNPSSFIISPTEGEGNIVFGVDCVGISVTVSCVYDIS